MEQEKGKEYFDLDKVSVSNYFGIDFSKKQKNYKSHKFIFFYIYFQEDNDEMRKEIDRNREKFEALKRFAMQKKISIPQELNQY